MSARSGLTVVDVVPWALVVLGWVIVNFQHNNREKRKEIRGKIDGLKRSLEELEDAAIQHHTVEQSSMGCMKIKRLIARVSRDVRTLSSTGLDISDGDQSVTRLRQSITLKNFESKRYKPLPSSHSILADIGNCADRLSSLLEHAYVERFLAFSRRRFMSPRAKAS